MIVSFINILSHFRLLYELIFVQLLHLISNAIEESVSIYQKFIAFKYLGYLLTSTRTPSIGKYCPGGLSLGTYRKNSTSFLYHLIEYNVSPSRSNLQVSRIVSPTMMRDGA